MDSNSQPTSIKGVTDNQDIQPRTVGSSWSYLCHYYLDGKKVAGGSSLEEVIRSEKHLGTICYLVRVTHDCRSILDRLAGVQLSEDDKTYYWEYMNDKGSYNYDVDSPDEPLPDSLKDFELTIPYPTQKGHHFTLDDMSTTVISTDTKIQTHAGSYTCVVYESIYDSDSGNPEDKTRGRFFMTPGIGMVRWEGDVLTDGKWVLDWTEDLVKYIPGTKKNK